MSRPYKHVTTNTPWGNADGVYKYARGINRYTTPSHGGFHVSAKLNQTIPEYMRNEDGWYEEDCEWCKVALVFKQYFDAKDVEAAIPTLRNWFPNEYELFFNIKLQPGESMQRDEALANEKHKNDFIVVSAFGSWHEKVPKGMVGLMTARGGRGSRETGYSYSDREIKWFLVSEEAYNNSDSVPKCGFVCYPGVDKEIEPLQ